MIKLNKGEAPHILKLNAQTWTNKILQKIKLNEMPSKSERSKYSHAEIKDAIVAETNGKCAYCESYIRHISYGDIEHVVPKSDKPELWFDWNNLTLACDICNTNKSSHLDVIDPYADDPELRVIFLGTGAWPALGDELAELSIRRLKLNRDELIGRRSERLERLMSMLRIITKTNDLELKKVLTDDFISKELCDAAEYASFSRWITKNLM